MQQPKEVKIRLMVAAVESILLYGNETWTLTAELFSRLDGVYKLGCLNVSWRDKWTNQKLYHGLPKVMEKVKARRLKLTGQIVFNTE